VIRTPTLFVLGAGASHPYGFPCGAKLRSLICDAASDHNPANRALVELGFEAEAVRNIASEFQDSNVPSIDAFLSRRPDLVEIGKHVIAANLCCEENPTAISSEETKDHWYRYLWSRLIEDTDSPHQLINNEVRFISFNYDRSLEYFLYVSTKRTYGVDDALALKCSAAVDPRLWSAWRF